MYPVIHLATKYSHILTNLPSKLHTLIPFLNIPVFSLIHHFFCHSYRLFHLPLLHKDRDIVQTSTLVILTSVASEHFLPCLFTHKCILRYPLPHNTSRLIHSLPLLEQHCQIINFKQDRRRQPFISQTSSTY